MANAVRIHAHGGPEALSYDEITVGHAGPAEVKIKHTAIGLNFLDTYYRSGLYPAPEMPLTPGGEAAGIVVETGDGVRDFKEGDRVAYTTPLGAYATERLIAADKLVKIPAGVTDEQAAAVMLKGLTAEYLLRRTYPIKPGETLLYHAAAGGVGLLLGQWAKHLGARTIGTAGSQEKVELAAQHGFDHVINYGSEDFVAEVQRLTGSAKCDVVYDSVGKDTFPGSLDCLKPRGMFVSFGQSSGPIPPFNMAILSQKGSLYATRPTLFTYIAARRDLEAAAEALFDVLAKGVVQVRINQRYPLSEAARAHADLEGRRTSGTTILLP